MKIEKVSIEDAEELLSIYAPYVENTAITFEYDVPSVSEFQKRIRDISSRFPYIKAVAGNEILGYAYANVFRTRVAYSWSVEVTIYVRQDLKRTGVGRLLYNALEKSLKEMGILNMYACISVPREPNKYVTNDSVCFHEKMGYQIVGTFNNTGFKFDTWFNTVWMEKIIGPHCKEVKSVRFGEWDIE